MEDTPDTDSPMRILDISLFSNGKVRVGVNVTTADRKDLTGKELARFWGLTVSQMVRVVAKEIERVSPMNGEAAEFFIMKTAQDAMGSPGAPDISAVSGIPEDDPWLREDGEQWKK